MKLKSIFAIALISMCSFTSCKNKNEETSREITVTENTQMAQNEYVCSMNCEKGKVYDKAGQCPVCKMDLVAKEHTHADSSHVK
jgi:uncharacterized paraquat-inducible protein A